MSIALIHSSTVSNSVPVKSYSFLSQPPPQKKRPTQPLPSPPLQAPASPCKPVTTRRRSATTSAITAWVTAVQPGSPAPLTPRRRPSLSSPRRPSISPRSFTRRPSINSGRVPSASFLNILDTPTTASRITPSVKDFKHDLTTVGYTSVFVHFPNTPSSTAQTSFPERRPSVTVLPVPTVPETPEKPVRRGLKHFRSLSALKPSRSRSKSTAMPHSTSNSASKNFIPPVPTISAHMRTQSRETVGKTKKSKYPAYRPVPLASELALAQLVDGGKMDDHIKRFTEAQARAAGAMVVDGKLVGVGDVYRDGQGGVWIDRDEELEYAHLLGGENHRAGDSDWVRFGSEASSASVSGDAEERRESVSSQDSDLDPRYAMQVEAEPRDDLVVFALPKMPQHKPGMSVLALPTRNRRAEPHLRKPEFLLDVFPVPDASSTVKAKAPLAPLNSSGPQTRPMGKERRRPAPITIAPLSPTSKCPTNPLDDVRKDFLENSYAPSAAPSTAHPTSTHHHHYQRPSEPSPRTPARVDSRSMVARKVALNTSKPSMKMDVRGLLRVMGGKKDI